MSPVDDVLGPGNPHLGTAKRSCRAGTVQGHVRPGDRLGKEDDVLVIAAEDSPLTREIAKIRSRGQSRRRPVARDRDVGEIVPTVERGDPWVLDTELFQLRSGNEADVCDLLYGPAITTEYDPQMRAGGEP